MTMEVSKKEILIKQPIFITLSLLGLFLLIAAGFLNSRLVRITKNNLESLTALNQVLPGFGEQTLEQLKKEVSRSEAQLLALAYLFDPPEKGLGKDYDLPIYFAEELDKITQFLKFKAANKQINYPDLGFKKTLPEEKEAKYLLKQLYSLKEVVEKGMDCGINFTALTPQPIEDLDVVSGVKLAKIRIEFTAAAPALIEFIIQLSEIAPLGSVESFLLKSQDSAFKADMLLSYTVIEADWKNKGMPFNPLNIKDIFLGQEKFINILRGNNPFFAPGPKEFATLTAKATAQQLKQIPRFLYKGKAILKSKEVAVIDDTLNKETVFLSLQEKIGDFILKELEESQIMLENINNAKQVIIKREEQ